MLPLINHCIRCNLLLVLVVTFTTNNLKILRMFMLFIACSIAMLQVPPSAAIALDFILESAPQVQDSPAAPVTWEGWQKDQSRMAWWLEHGWQLLEGSKPGMEPLALADASMLDRSDFNPLQLNVEPVNDRHVVWSVTTNRTLILYSLSLCEVLYQRHAINQSAY